MNDTELIRQLRNALCCARGYMSDAIENESPCAKKDGGLVDEVEALVAAARRVLDKAWEFGEDEPHFVALDNAVDALTGAKP